MILLAKKLGPVFLLALFLFSCEEPGDIDLGVRPTDRLTVRTAEFTLGATQMRFDSINTANSQTLMVGANSDFEFGQINAKSFTEFGLGINSNSITNASTFDSLVLQLALRFTLGTNFSTPQEIKVHRLSENLFDTVSYYNFREARYDADPLGYYSKTLQSGIDTVIRIRLSDALGQEIVDKAKAGTGELSSSNAFRTFLKGLALIPGENNDVVVGFDTQNALTRLMLYHHTDSDTLQFDFVVGNTNHFSNIRHNRRNTPLEGLNQQKTDMESTNGFLYTQSGTGIFINLDFENLFRFADTLSNFKINLAELQIKTQAPPNNRIRPQQRLSFYYLNANNGFVIRPAGFLGVQVDGADQNSPFNPLSIVFNPTALTYKESVTGYAQALLDDRVPYRKTIVFPFDLGGTLDRAKIAKEDIKLKVYYTVVNN